MRLPVCWTLLVHMHPSRGGIWPRSTLVGGSTRGVTGQSGQPAVGGTDQGLRLCTGGRARTHRPKPPTLVGGHCPGPASRPQARADMPVFPSLLAVLASTAWRPSTALRILLSPTCVYLRPHAAGNNFTSYCTK